MSGKPHPSNPILIVDDEAAILLAIDTALQMAGLIIIGSVAGMAKQSLGNMAWIVVALLAIGNASGRVVAGILSERSAAPKHFSPC